MLPPLEVTVDSAACLGSGQCLFAAPDVFDQSEDTGIVILLNSQPAPELHDAVRHAAHVCPSQAITLSASVSPTGRPSADTG